MNSDGSSVRFDKVRQREFRMTLGKHPDAQFVPVECSWDFESCVEIDVDEHDHQNKFPKVFLLGKHFVQRF